MMIILLQLNCLTKNEWYIVLSTVAGGHSSSYLLDTRLLNMQNLLSKQFTDSQSVYWLLFLYAKTNPITYYPNLFRYG